MYGALDISTSGMVAQRTRLDVISANIANANTMQRSDGGYEPYRRRAAMFAPGDPSSPTRTGQAMGVHVAAIELDQAPFDLQYKPNSPYADAEGYVKMPNIDTTVEQINAMEASRAYEANVVAAETTKTMMAQALRLLA
ncbi:MAG: flagellar basal-body rod protein FlgC [Phycisphaeraceae bacterium]|nr:MAG: flagellar basal-body rod protein FlgC [Phycisphaeraceae bacterium]